MDSAFFKRHHDHKTMTKSKTVGGSFVKLDSYSLKSDYETYFFKSRGEPLIANNNLVQDDVVKNSRVD